MYEKLTSAVSIKGRANRALYWRTVGAIWLTLVVTMLLFAAADHLDVASERTSSGELSDLILVAIMTAGVLYLMWIGFAVAVRRLHDRDKTGWWTIPFLLIPGLLNGIVQAERPTDGRIDGAQALLALIALGLAAWGFVEIGCAPGTSGSNRFGSDPLVTDSPPAEQPPQDPPRGN